DALVSGSPALPGKAVLVTSPGPSHQQADRGEAPRCAGGELCASRIGASIRALPDLCFGIVSGCLGRVLINARSQRLSFLIALTQYLFDSLHDWHLKILLVAAIILHLAHIFFQGLQIRLLRLAL